jgi:hypothetical protein
MLHLEGKKKLQYYLIEIVDGNCPPSNEQLDRSIKKFGIFGE